MSAIDVKKFRTDGYFLLSNFLSHGETDSLLEECSKLIEEMDVAEHKSVFESGSESSHILDEYFLSSGDKIRFFYEGASLDDEGNLKYNKQQSLNKIGHALHWLNDKFRKITFSDKVKPTQDTLWKQDVAKCLDFINPVIIQSMLILKPSNIGSKVDPHQDATYLYCEPDNKVVGLWIALEDATVENGCLWFIPGSHTGTVQRRMIRSQTADGQCKMVYTTPPETYDNTKFVPVPAKKGDMILIDGKVVHMSESNTSECPRPIYTFHILDDSGAKFSKLNWIQPSQDLPFTPLFNN